MFGKGKTRMNSTGKFIMAAGRAVGNVKIAPPKGSENRKGNGTAPKTAPVKAAQARPLPLGMQMTRSDGKRSPAQSRRPPIGKGAGT